MAKRNGSACVALFALAAVAAVAACSGNSSSGTPGSMPAASLQSVAQAAGPEATPQNPYPISTGYTLKYDYNSKVVAQPSAAPVQLSSTVGTVTTIIEGSANFNGAPHIDARSLMSVTFSNDNGNTTGSSQKTTDDYESFDTVGSNLDYDLYGYVDNGTSSDSTGATTVSSDVDTYNDPFILDQLPEAAGASWTTAVGFTASTSSQTTKNGSVTSQTVTTESHGSDGSYMSQVTQTNGKGTYEVVKTQNSNGSGSEQNGGTGSQAGLTEWGTPSLSAGKYVIPVTYTPPNGKATTTNVPDWYPGNGKIGKLYTDGTKDVSLEIPIPKACGHSLAHKAAVKLAENTTFLDVINGAYRTTETDRYVISGIGLVCTVHDRTTKTYDNLATGILQRTEHETTVTGLKKV